MFARVFAAIFASSVLLAATAAPAPSHYSNSQCNGGDVVCCNQWQEASSESEEGRILSLDEVSVSDLTGLVGSNCSPISVLAISGNTWYAQAFYRLLIHILMFPFSFPSSNQAVCCENNQFSEFFPLQQLVSWIAKFWFL